MPSPGSGDSRSPPLGVRVAPETGCGAFGWEEGDETVAVFGFELGLGLGDAGATPMLQDQAPGWVQMAGFVLPVKAVAKAMIATVAAAAMISGDSTP